MNVATLQVYEAIKREGTQKNVVPLMQTRAELYRYLDYEAYEKKLDALFAKGKGSVGGCVSFPSSQNRDLGKLILR